jgi:hypothetical protein
MNGRSVFFTAVALLLCACAVAPAFDPRSELEAMYESDQRHRAALMEAFRKHGPGSPEVTALEKAQQSIDQDNLQRLEKIVANGGWPKLSVVGQKAASAAFLIVQHADLATQQRYLLVVRQAVTAGEARASDLALLEDRVLVGQGRKQLYGSQLQSDGKGGWQFYPIEDEAHVDERRRSVGLPPLTDYARLFGVEYPAVGGRPVVPSGGAVKPQR